MSGGLPAVRAGGVFARALRLTAAEWSVLVESAALALVVEAALRLVSLRRVLALIQRTDVSQSSRLGRAEQQRIARLARWPFRLSPLPSTCLRIALVQVAVLRRRGAPATVRFGVRPAGGSELEFHAWAECDGPLDDAADAARYRPFSRPYSGRV
jgi:hypothetical protein